jgi:hypothetical protein
LVVSSEKNVEASMGYGFNIIIKHVGNEAGDMPSGTYVCEFVVRDKTLESSVYESTSVFVTVTA